VPFSLSFLPALILYTNNTFLSSISDALYILYPGEYVLGSILFLVTLFVLKNDIEYIRRQQRASEEQVGSRTVQGSIAQRSESYGDETVED
jgi:hypothetical protein